MRTLELASAWILLLLPLTFIAWVCATGPEIPHMDYWGWLHNFVTPDGFTSSFSRWTTRTTNQFLTGSFLIYAFNLVVTGGSNRGLTLLSWLFAVGILAILGAWVHRSLGRSKPIARWATVVTSWLLFSPLLAVFFIQGFAGVAKLGSVFFSVVAIHFWVTYERNRRRIGLVACVLAVGLALSLFTSALVLLPLLALAAAPRAWRGGRTEIAYIASLALIMLLWLLGYDTEVKTAGHPEVGIAGAASLLLYPFSFLGIPFTRVIEIGLGAGVLGATATVGLALRTLRGAANARLGSETCWWLLIGFALGNAILTAGARSSMGLGQAFASRYSVFPVLFWISLGVLSMIHSRRAAHRWLALGALCLVMLTSHVNGLSYYQALRHRGLLEPATRIALQRDFSDTDSISYVITGWPQRFHTWLPVLRARHWVPFEPNGLKADPTQRAPIVDVEYPDAGIWAFRTLPSSGQPDFRLAGHLPSSLGLRFGTELLMLNHKGLEIGRAAVVPAPRLDLDHQDSFWIGYLSTRRVRNVYLALPEGDIVAEFRCCDASRPIAMDFNPYKNPYPIWFHTGRYRSTWLRSLVEH